MAEHNIFLRAKNSKSPDETYYASLSDEQKAQNYERMKARRDANPPLHLWTQAKHRARRLKVPFTITVSDVVVPETCPVLGIKLRFGTHAEKDCSPSIDRIENRWGYIPGNIVVVSMRVNRLKAQLAPGELTKIADFYARFPERHGLALADTPEIYMMRTDYGIKPHDRT